jgi:hypothetical protein
VDVSEFAHNNAQWCDAVCRAHAIAGRFSYDAWTSPLRTPPLYPDAVTLRPGVDPVALLSGIDASPGCSIKDSFCDVDLGPAGFIVLFWGWWIYYEPGVPRTSSWSNVADEQTFRAWEWEWIAHGGAPNVLHPTLLEAPGMSVLADIRDGEVVAGAIAYRTDSVVGLSNNFTRDDNSWDGCRDAVVSRYPDITIVAYEAQDSIAFPQQSGFEPVAPVRVWVRPQ